MHMELCRGFQSEYETLGYSNRLRLCGILNSSSSKVPERCQENKHWNYKVFRRKAFKIKSVNFFKIHCFDIIIEIPYPYFCIFLFACFFFLPLFRLFCYVSLHLFVFPKQRSTFFSNGYDVPPNFHKRYKA